MSTGRIRDPSSSRIPPGTVFDGRYVIGDRMGGGASGVVYRATDTLADDAEVALKVLRRGLRDHRSIELEFSILARLHHENVVRVERYSVAKEGPGYLVAEFIDGPTLGQANTKVDPLALMILARGILRGLDAIHRAGYVHHDIKPENVLIAGAGDSPDPRRWTPKITDLGVAALRGADPRGRVSGTVPYLAPERLAGREAAPVSDIWSLGMTLLVAASNVVPIDTGDVREAMALVHSRKIPLLRDVEPDAPKVLEDFIARLLVVDLRDRPQSAAEALDELDRIETGQVGAQQADRAFVGDVPTLFGRDSVTDTIAAVCTSLPGTHRRCAVVRGPSGSGRTAVLADAALAAQLAGVDVVWVPPGVGREPWLAALRELGGADAADAALDIVDDLARLAYRRSFLLLCDDLDRRDGLAVHVVENLAPALWRYEGEHRVGLALSVDPTRADHPEVGFVVVELEPLTDEDIDSLCHAALGDAVEAPVLRFARARSGGNPAAAIEAIRSLSASGDLRRVAGTWHLSDDVGEAALDNTMFSGRVEALPDAARSLLSALSVYGPAGTGVTLAQAHRLCGLHNHTFFSAVSTLCAGQLAHFVGYSDGASKLALTSEGARAVALADIDPAARQKLHRAAYDLLTSLPNSPLGLRCSHALGAGLRAEGLELARAAVTEALATRDYMTVLSVADVGSLAGQDSEVRDSFELACARAYVGLSRPAAAMRIASAMLERRPDHAEALLVGAQAAVRAGDGERAQLALDALGSSGASVAEPGELAVLQVNAKRFQRRLDEAIALARQYHAEFAAPDQSRTRAELELALGHLLLSQGDEVGARPLLAQARATFSSLGAHAEVADAECYLAACADMAADSDAVELHIARGLERAEAAGSHGATARLLNIRAINKMWRGRPDEAAAAFAEAERRADRAGLVRVASAAAGNASIAYRRCGLFGRCLANAARSLAIKYSQRDQIGATATLLNMVDAYCEIGAIKTAVAGARHALRVAEQLDNVRFAAMARSAVARSARQAGDLEVASRASKELEDIAGKIGAYAEIEVWIERALLLDASGETPRGLALLRDAANQAIESDDAYLGSLALLERGRLLGDVGAEDLRRAIDLASSCGAREILWTARALLGELLLSVGRAQEAGGEFARAGEVLAEVIADLPSRFVVRYIGFAGRDALIRDIEEHGGIAAAASERVRDARRSNTSATTVVGATSASADVPELP